jgi:hypothetical protein
VNTLDDRVGQVLGIVRTILANPDLGADDEVMDHGGTSLSVVRILAETRQSLQLTINPRDLKGSVTARSLAQAAR